MKPIIEITGLGKKYPIVHDKLPYSTLRDSIVNFIKHPFSSRKARESFWALKDINLTINRGDIIGIIGKNGAGKSTLLKILSGITKPTEGKVKLYGRVSSLLEVGTGFHPELTGRENIYLNGVILGMTRKEVSKKFDEIVAFAGIEKFLDTPVKHYSSGMYVRLAFAVAAHLEPDILIVDEVLAVGDIEFQKKCLGKMEEVSKEEGRTVIFVSHNMGAISTLTNKCVYLDKGKISLIGETKDAISLYLNKYIEKDLSFKKEIDYLRASILEANILTSEPNNIQTNGKKLIVNIKFYLPEKVNGASLSYQIVNEDGVPYAHLWTYDDILPMGRARGIFDLSCTINKCRLYMGKYHLKIYLAGAPSYNSVLDVVDNICYFEVTMHGQTRDYPWLPETCTYLEEGNWILN